MEIEVEVEKTKHRTSGQNEQQIWNSRGWLDIDKERWGVEEVKNVIFYLTQRNKEEEHSYKEQSRDFNFYDWKDDVKEQILNKKGKKKKEM